MFNATPQYSYNKVPMEVPQGNKKDAPEELSFWSRVTFSWVLGRLNSAQESVDRLVPGQRSTFWNWRDLRLWKVVLSFPKIESFTQLFLLQISILCARILQPTMFSFVFTSDPLFVSPVPWYWAALTGYWLSVSVEGLVRSHYSYSAEMTSGSVKSGLNGLVFDKVILIQTRECFSFINFSFLPLTLRMCSLGESIERSVYFLTDHFVSILIIDQIKT